MNRAVVPDSQTRSLCDYLKVMVVAMGEDQLVNWAELGSSGARPTV